jgi:general secretion pathway protein K
VRGAEGLAGQAAECPPAGEAGYALVAAVASLLVFGLLALGVAQSMRGTIVSGGSEIEAARAAAAADAGIAIAIHHLLADDPRGRWPIDGRPIAVRFDSADIVVRVIDERGKVPLNLIEEQELTPLLRAAGLEGQRLRIARDSFLDWRDEDEEPRLEGAEAAYYRPFDVAPPNNLIASVSELGRIRGFDAALVERLRPAVTVHFGSGPFDPRFAHPMAIGAMLQGGADSPAAIARARELRGQRTAIALDGDVELIGRPLTVMVDARLPSGARARRALVIELTGADRRPYVVRGFG